MNGRPIAKLKITLDPQWASHSTDVEIESFLKERLSTAIGFRGEVKTIKIVRD